jgi:hypothetical protein
MKCTTNRKGLLGNCILLCIAILPIMGYGQVTTCTSEVQSITWNPNYRNRIDIVKGETTEGAVQVESLFQTKDTYKQHVTTIFSGMRLRRNRTRPVSMRRHLGMAVVISDNDGIEDNCNNSYKTLIILKEDDNMYTTQFYISGATSSTPVYPYTIGFYIGSEVRDFEYDINQDVPGDNWGTTLFNDQYTDTLTKPTINASRNQFLLLDTYLKGILYSLTIRVK